MRISKSGAAFLLAALLLAACEGGAEPQRGVETAQPATRPASIELSFSPRQLPSAGLAGSEVAVVAQVKTAAGNGVAGARIDFSADSGVLTAVRQTTDASGQASATLATGGSKLNRPVKVSVRVGDQVASGEVDVVGTRLTLSGPATVMVGRMAELTASLVDSAGGPIDGATVSASATDGNAVPAAIATSDSRGRAPLRIKAVRPGTEHITVAGMGATAATTITVIGK